MSQRKILILGGTGAMGVHLVNLLKKENIQLYVTSRSARKSGDGVEYLRGNAKELPFLKSVLALNHWDAIIDFMVYGTNDFQQRVQLLLSSTEHYLFLSSSRVYADSQTPITESSPRLLDVSEDRQFLATDEYALSKAREENILMNQDCGNWTIIRPYITFSENRLQLGVLEKDYWLYQALHGRTIVFSKDIAEKTTTLTYGYDVARGIAALIGQEKAAGRVFHITVSECHTWQEIFDLYCHILTKHLGYEPKTLMLEENPRVRIPHSKYQVVYDRYFNRRFDNTAIGEFIDVSTFKPTMAGLEQCLQDFLQHPSYHIDSWTQHAQYDRITGEWTRISEIPSWEHRMKYLLRRTIMPK